MFSGKQGSNVRFLEEAFIAEHNSLQSRTLRRAIAKVINLPEQYADEFYTIVKKDPNQRNAGKDKFDYYGAEDLLPVGGLTMLYPLELPDGDLHKEVVKATRGTIIYNLKFRVGIPIQTPDDIVMSALSETPAGKVPINTGLKSVNLLKSTIRIRNYELGTIMRMFFFNGEVVWVTQHNVLPGGAYHKGIRLHKEAIRGKVNFMELVKKIAAAVDPTLLTGEGWFPAGCKFSNKEYRFVLRNKYLSACDYNFDGTDSLVLIGCFEQWDNRSPPPDTDIGVPHKGWFQTGAVTRDFLFFDSDDSILPNALPKFTRPADKSIPYVMNSTDFGNDLEKANAILAGDKRIPTETLNGAGKIIITGRTSEGGNLFTFHGVSPAWQHRERTLGNDASLYQGFWDQLVKQDYDLSDSDQRKIYLELFPPVLLPGNLQEDLISLEGLQAIIRARGDIQEEFNQLFTNDLQIRNEVGALVNSGMISGQLATIYRELLYHPPDMIMSDRLHNIVQMAGEIPVVLASADYTEDRVISRDVRHIWFIFLLAANKAMRPIVYFFLLRYIAERDRLVNFLYAEVPATMPKFDKTMSEEDIKEQRNLVSKLQNARRHAIPAQLRSSAEVIQKKAIKEYLSNHREFTRKAISTMMKYTGEKQMFQRLTDPDYNTL